MAITEEQRAKYNATRRRRYAEDPEYRAQINKLNRVSRDSNREQMNAARRDRRKNDPEWRELQNVRLRGRDQRNSQLKTLYGISLNDYNEMLRRQGRLCRICGKPNDKKLHVDHDHETNKLRNLLCPDCNRGLGCFKDSPALMILAADYVRSHRASDH